MPKGITDGLKHDGDKIRMELLPVESLLAVAEVMTYGAKKYTADSWKKVSTDRYEGALLRHYVAHKTGELRDEESGLLHAAHMATNALFILYQEIKRIEAEEEKEK